jgi:hypothetical protein
MSFRTELKASITVQDPDLPHPGLEVLDERIETVELVDEFVEMLLTVPFTALDIPFTNGKPIVFNLAGLEPRTIFIKSSGPIGVVQYMTTPQAAVLQPCRTMLVLTYDPLNPPTEIRLLNLNADPVDVKLLISSNTLNL